MPKGTNGFNAAQPSKQVAQTEKRRIIIFGGCTGIGKSDLLNEALKNIQDEVGEEFYANIKISKLFRKALERPDRKDKSVDRNIDEDEDVIWYEDNWKKHDKKVLKALLKEIEVAGEKIIIINKHFSAISSYGYLPGLDMDSLEELLKFQRDHFCPSTNPMPEPCFGLLLIDTDKELIHKHYEDLLFKDQPAVLQYISLDNIQKDLEENRKWAELYCSRAIAILGADKVHSETIYINAGIKENDLDAIINKISDFINRFR